jgi:hypothetical protein
MVATPLLPAFTLDHPVGAPTHGPICWKIDDAIEHFPLIEVQRYYDMDPEHVAVSVWRGNAQIMGGWPCDRVADGPDGAHRFRFPVIEFEMTTYRYIIKARFPDGTLAMRTGYIIPFQDFHVA